MCSERPRDCLRLGGGGAPGARVQLWPLILPRSAGGPRKGYMGHLTRLANALVQNTEKGPNAEQLGQLLKGEGQGVSRPRAGGRGAGVEAEGPLMPCLLLTEQNCPVSSRNSGRPLCLDPWQRPTRRTQWTW